MSEMEQSQEQKHTKGRELYEKTLKQEKKRVANDILYTFADYGLVAGIENLQSLLTEDDILLADAERMNELKDKEKDGQISAEEKEELEMRTRGDIYFTNEANKRDFQKSGVGSGFNVLRWNEKRIKGVLDGQSVDLLKKTFNRNDRDNKFFTIPNEIVYHGISGEEYLEDEEAQKLFEEYLPFAQMRTEEIEELKRQKETKALGHTIDKAA